MEFWTQMSGPKRAPADVIPEHVRRLEDEGWRGVTITDSQSLGGDVYVAMTVAALSSSRIRLATGVTNPWTRHPAVAAAAAITVNQVSSGRVEIGIGRGDSSLAHIGLAPTSVEHFGNYLSMLQAYLAGEEVSIVAARDIAGGAAGEAKRGRRDVATLNLAHQPAQSQLTWLEDDGLGKVPVFVTASGPQVLTMSAKRADRVAIVVGADPERVEWAIQLIRTADADVAVSAYVDVLVTRDPDEALRRGAGRLATHARFSVMHGKVMGPMASDDDSVARAIARNYDMTTHAQHNGRQAKQVSRDFAERFAIIGEAPYCVDRLRELESLGVDRFHVWGFPDDPAGTESDLFASEVLSRVGA